MSEDAFDIRDEAHQPMSAEREREIVARAQAGDTVARDELVRVWIPWAREWAFRYAQRVGIEHTAVVDDDDLLQEALIGVFTSALRKYDLASGYRFSTYATHWIRNRITRARSQQSPTIRQPEYLAVVARKVMRRRMEIEQQIGRAPTDAELMAWGGVTAEDIERWRISTSTQAPLSIEMTTTSEFTGNEVPLSEAIPDDRLPPMDDLVLAGMERAEVWRIVDDVLADYPRYRQVLAIRYGRGGGEGKTLEETGAELGISRERTRQIQERALLMLQESPAMQVYGQDMREEWSA